MKQVVSVSHEMTTLVGLGPPPLTPLPADSASFLFEGFSDGEAPVLSHRPDCNLDGIETIPLAFVVMHAASRRLFPVRPHRSESWHLPSGLRDLARSIIECEGNGEAKVALRLARSIELLCQIHAALAAGSLVPTNGEGGLSEMDVARIASARQIIDQRWHEKLTIAQLSRGAGINRDKLVRGFRELYGASIAEVLCERRLGEARRMLLASDLPIATVAYRCSYLNNASFSRAFTRRFGVPPSELRRTGVAA